MGAAYINFDSTPLFFEVVSNESTRHTARMSDHPVEKGADITDHVRQESDSVTLEVFISNTPLRDINNVYGGSMNSVLLNVPVKEQTIYPTPGSLENAAIGAIGNAISELLNGPPPPLAMLVTTWPTKFDAIKDVVTQLLLWKEGCVVGEVILPYRSYDSMLITEVDIDRDATTGGGAKVSISFRAVRLVTAKLVNAPVPTETRGALAQNKGRQDPAPVPPAEAEKVVSDAKAQVVSDAKALANLFGFHVRDLPGGV